MAAEQDQWELLLRANDSLTPVLGNVAGSILKVTAAAAGLASIGSFLADSTREAVESEKQWNSLGASVRSHGGDWMRLGEDVRGFATDLQQTFGISDELVAESIAKFLDYGASVTTSMSLFRNAMDLARGRTIELGSAVDVLARAYGGNTLMLQRHLMAVGENVQEGEKFEVLLQKLNTQFGGRAQADIGTMATKLDVLAQSWGELKEAVGGFVVESELVPAAITGWTQLINDLTDALKGPDLTTETGISSGLVRIMAQIQEIEKINDKSWLGPDPAMLEALRTLNREYEVLSVKLRALQARPEAEDTTNLAASNLRGIGVAGEMTSASVAAERYEEHLAELNQTLAQTLKLMRGQDIFDGLGDTMSKGFSTLDAQAAKEQERLKEAFAFGGDGPQSWIVEHDMVAAEIEARQLKMESFIKGSMMNVSDSIILALSGVRVDAGDVFKGMATDFSRFFINSVLEDVAGKLAGKLTGLLGGSLLGALGLGAAGLFVTAGLGILSRGGSRSGGSGGSSARGRNIGGGPTGASVHIETLVTNERYIEDIVAPTLDRLQRVGATG